MTTKDFKKMLNENDFEYNTMGDIISVLYKEFVVAEVYENLIGSVDTHYAMFDKLEKRKKAILLGLIYEYVTTPVERRTNESDLYYLMFSIDDNQHFENEYKIPPFLNYNRTIKKYTFGTRDQTFTHQTKFTKEEIDKIPMSIIKHFTRVKVE